MARTAKQHDARALGLNKQTLPHSIIEVVATLHRAGFEAYIVGGGVRDSLLGLAPKDFDAVTNAKPYEIKDLFGGRCRIIGRRFQLAHVYSGREMIEVATFRAPPKDDAHTTDGGMITRDNVWGDIHQDFERRDFSINALYYDPIKGVVHDFCGALDDIKNRKLLLLGKASVRIEEDPVRLLRALRFRAKLGFDFDKELARQFHADNWQKLLQVSTHRLYDESQKMFGGGYLSPLLPLLYEYGAMENLIHHAGDKPTALMTHVAQTTDARIGANLGANPAYFYATLLWSNYLHNLAKFKKKLPFYDAQVKAAARTLERQRVKTAIPRFAEEFISQIWLLQPKLTAPKPKDVEVLIKHPRFRAAYDFLVAREAADDEPLSEPTNGMGAWWMEYQLFDAKARQSMSDELSSGTRRRRDRAGTKANEQSHAELEQLQQLSLADSCQISAAKPLFETDYLPKKRPREVLPPVFAKVSYSDEEFARLLAEENYAPPKRRHRNPSTAATAEPSGETPTKSKAKKLTDKKTAVAEKTSSDRQKKPSLAKKPSKKAESTANKAESITEKPKRKRKSNAKPKADDHA
ncbi:MAG: polynucleotide adenylyltransferase PcnB [Moraxella sp.]|nr:polynucleotide adenylyltransferase PcnB [Moraxella sp.]